MRGGTASTAASPARSWAGVRTTHGTSKPANSPSTVAISLPTAAVERRALRTKTLPDWMCVATSVKPASSSATRRSAIFTKRPPTLTARRNAT